MKNLENNEVRKEYWVAEEDLWVETPHFIFKSVTDSDEKYLRKTDVINFLFKTSEKSGEIVAGLCNILAERLIELEENIPMPAPYPEPELDSSLDNSYTIGEVSDEESN